MQNYKHEIHDNQHLRLVKTTPKPLSKTSNEDSIRIVIFETGRVKILTPYQSLNDQQHLELYMTVIFKVN